MVGIRAGRPEVAIETFAAALRAACLTLVGAAPGVMNAITVSHPLPGGDATQEKLEYLVAGVAGELGLFAILEVSETRVAVRLVRAEPSADLNEKDPSRAEATGSETDEAMSREIRSLWQRLGFAKRNTVSS